MQINRCPKCGKKPKVMRTVRFALTLFDVRCNDCHMHTGCRETRDEAIEKWNELTKGEAK